MLANKLNYHRRKFEDDVLEKKHEPKCRIWSNEEIQNIIEQIDPRGNLPTNNRSFQNFRVLKALEVKELRYLDPYNKDPTCQSLKVIALEDLFDSIYWSWEQTGCAGWKPLHHKIREQGCYISIEVVKLFLKHSPNHQARINKTSQKSLVTNPILSKCFGLRGQVDLLRRYAHYSGWRIQMDTKLSGPLHKVGSIKSIKSQEC